MKRVPIAALILIVLGVIFLMQNLGYLPIPLRQLFATWWPLILIIVGVSLLLRK